MLVSGTNCIYANDEQNFKNLPLFEYQDYQKIYPENIKSLKIIRYTEGGADEKEIKDHEQINQIYNYLSKIKLLDKSGMSCTDNTTVYSFTLMDNSKASVEIECNWVVIKGKNYNFTTDKNEVFPKNSSRIKRKIK